MPLTGLGSKYVTIYTCKNKFICTLCFFGKATRIFLSSSSYIMYIGLEACDGVAQESTVKISGA